MDGLQLQRMCQTDYDVFAYSEGSRMAQSTALNIGPIRRIKIMISVVKSADSVGKLPIR